MKNYLKPLLLMGLLCVSLVARADEIEMKEDLVQIVELMESIKPLLEKAERDQPKDARIKIQFESYTDSEGKTHSGLITDLEAIQQSLKEIVNQQGLEERDITPVKGDFER